MAIFTGLARVIFGVEIPLVYILVAIRTAIPDIPEGPFVFIQMAGKARRCQVGTIQRKLCFAMVLKTEQRDIESVLGMAIRTIANRNRSGECPFVIIFMAGSTGIVRQ